MNDVNKQVVFGSANYWTSPYQVGSHSWARLFAKNSWDVTYISDPISPLHCLNSRGLNQVHERFHLHSSPRDEVREGRVTPWVPLSMFTPLNQPVLRSAWALEEWHQFTHPSIQSYLNSVAVEPDLIWLDSVRHYGWAKEVGASRIAFRVADWSAGFPDVAPSAVEYEKRVVQEADIVIATAESLAERVSSWRGKGPIHTIRNGVDFNFWNTQAALPDEYKSIPEPRIVYVGALDSWFDFSLLRKMAVQFPKYSFVVIGQLKSKPPVDLSLPNLHFLGSKKRSEVRGYLQHAQVGIIPFIRNDLIDCVCPLKLYEYSACGLPVMATYWTELELMKSPALLAHTQDEWIHYLEKVPELVQSGNKSGLIQYAQANDWSNRWSEWNRISAVPS